MLPRRVSTTSPLKIQTFTPQVPYAQTIPYMEKSPILQEWRRLNAAGELAGPQKLWFAPHKPDEELYDTAADPDEVNNLAGKPEHAATLQLARLPEGLLEHALVERIQVVRVQPVAAIVRHRPGIHAATLRLESQQLQELEGVDRRTGQDQVHP